MTKSPPTEPGGPDSGPPRMDSATAVGSAPATSADTANPDVAREVPPKPTDARGAAGWVLGGLAAWGIALGLGAALFQPSVEQGITLSFRPMRGLLVLACVGAFMGCWGLLLFRRSRRSGD